MARKITKFETTVQRNQVESELSARGALSDIAHSVVGIGDSGREVALAIMRKGDHPQTHISVVNSDTSGLEQMNGKDVLLLNSLPIPKMLDEIDKDPKRFSGWQHIGPTDRIRKALGSTEDLLSGFRTVRALGAPAMLYMLCRRYNEVSEFVYRPTLTLLGVDNPNCLSKKQKRQIGKQNRLLMHHLFAGTGGGTGPLVNLLAHIIQSMQRDVVGVESHSLDVDLILPGPNLYLAVEPQMLLANTYATLQEISQGFERAFSTIQLGPLRLERAHSPIRNTFLYGDRDLAGRMRTAIKDIADEVALVWKLRSLGPEGEEYRARHADRRFTSPNVFSSGGAYELHIFASDVVTEFALRTAMRVIATIGTDLDDHQAKKRGHQAVLALFSRHPEMRDMPTFRTDLHGKRIEAKLGRLSSTARRTLPKVLERAITQKLSQCHASLVERLETSIQEMNRSLNSYLEEVLNQQSGLSVALAFLSELAQSFEELRTSQQRKLDRALSNHQRCQEALAGRKSNTLWQVLGTNPRQHYVSKHQAMVDAELDVLQQNTLLLLIQTLLETAQKRQEGLSTWHLALHTLVERLEDERQNWLQYVNANRSVVEESVLCEAEIEELYTRSAQLAVAQVIPNLRFSWSSAKQAFTLMHKEKVESSILADQPVLSEEGIQGLVEHCSNPWLHLYDLSVEDVLRSQGRSPEAVVDELMIKAAPLIAINEAKQIPAENRLMVLGSDTCDFFKSLLPRTGLSIVSTGDKQRLSFLYTVHGIDFTNLLQVESWRQAYEQLTHKGFPLHLFPGDFEENCTNDETE